MPSHEAHVHREIKTMPLDGDAFSPISMPVVTPSTKAAAMKDSTVSPPTAVPEPAATKYTKPTIHAGTSTKPVSAQGSSTKATRKGSRRYAERNGCRLYRKRRRPWLSALIAFIGVLILLWGITGVLFLIFRSQAQDAARARFRTDADALSTFFFDTMVGVDRSLQVAASGFRALSGDPFKINRLTANTILSAATVPFLPSLSFRDYVTGPDRLEAVYEEYGLPSPFDGGIEPTIKPRVFGSGFVELPLDLDTESYFFTTYTSDVGANDVAFGSGFDQLFIDTSRVEPRDELIRCSAQLGGATCAKPTPRFDQVALPGILAFRMVENSETHTPLNGSSFDGIQGLIAANMYRENISVFIDKNRAIGSGDFLWWVVRDVETNRRVLSSGAAGRLMEGTNIEYSRVFRLLQNDWVFQAGSTPAYYDFVMEATPQVALVVGGILAVVLAGLAATIAHLLERREMFRLNAAHASQEAAEAEVVAYEKVLGYVNHEIRNPLNVLVASLEFVDEVVSRRVQRARMQRLSTSSDDDEASLRMPTVMSHGAGLDLDGDAPEVAGPAPTITITSPKSDTAAEDLRMLEDVAAMREAAYQMERQVNDMLDFQRLKQGRMILEPSPVHVFRLIRRIAVEHQVLTDVPIEVEAGPCEGIACFPRRVVVDELRLRQLLVNGLTNAIKFTQEGQIRIVVSLLHEEAKVAIGTPSALANTPAPPVATGGTTTARETAALAPLSEEKTPPTEGAIPPSYPQAMLRVVVEDSGEGLQGKASSELFKPFATFGAKKPKRSASALLSATSRYSRRKTPLLASTGLGLPICKLLAERMGGIVTLYDTGHGCCFQVDVPVNVVDPRCLLPEDGREGDSPPIEQRSSGLPASSQESKESFEFHALVIDDMPNNVRLTRRILDRMGCRTEGLSEPSFKTRLLRALAERDQLLPHAAEMIKADSQPAVPQLSPHAKSPLHLRRPYDLIFLDIRLGDEDGTEILQSVQPLLKPGNRLRFVAMTASATREDVAMYKELGFTGCVAKPISFKAVRNLLTAIAAGHQHWPTEALH